jgi:xanthosine utilization system XapX-like protein
MGLSHRERRAIRRELRQLVFQLAVVAGMFGGLLWALGRPEEPPPASCAPSQRSSGMLGECVGDSLLAGMLPYLGGMAAGAVGGALFAAVLVRVVLPATNPAGARGRWITARYVGSCGTCRGAIVPGDRIWHGRAGSVCGECRS